MPAVCESAWPGCGLSGSVPGPNPFTSHIEGRGVCVPLQVMAALAVDP